MTSFSSSTTAIHHILMSNIHQYPYISDCTQSKGVQPKPPPSSADDQKVKERPGHGSQSMDKNMFTWDRHGLSPYTSTRLYKSPPTWHPILQVSSIEGCWPESCYSRNCRGHKNPHCLPPVGFRPGRLCGMKQNTT